MSESNRPPVSREVEHHVAPAGIDTAPQPHLGITRLKRLRKRCHVPEGARSREEDPTTFVLQELDVNEVESARKLADGNQTRSMMEQVKLSLYEVDGRIVDHTRDEGTYYFNRWSQKVRELAVVGYDAVASNKSEDITAFLSSMESV